MKFLAATAAICLLNGVASAETLDCKTLTEPVARLTCYDNINPPIDASPIPSPKPSDYSSRTGPDGTPGGAEISEDGEDAVMKAKLNSICRGC